jgi:hypothetical protein
VVSWLIPAEAFVSFRVSATDPGKFGAEEAAGVAACSCEGSAYFSDQIPKPHRNTGVGAPKSRQRSIRRLQPPEEGLHRPSSASESRCARCPLTQKLCSPMVVLPGCEYVEVGGYDIIGDIHGCATYLTDLLAGLGYEEDWTGVHWHPERQAIYVGDLIDRGGEQLRVLEIVKGMVDSGSAQIVMGNHEFNAIAYSTQSPDGNGEFLRRHSEKNTKQHQSFLDQVTGPIRDDYLQWFKTIPLWLDLGGLRIIHACWHEDSMRIVKEALGSNRFNAMDQFVRATTEGEPLYDAIEVLLKGPEISLAKHDQPPYCDKDGHPRDRARVAWWKDEATTLRDLAVMDNNFQTRDGRPYPVLPCSEVDASERSYCYRADIPVVYGHYWRTGTPEQGQDWTSRTACVDFSAVSTGEPRRLPMERRA